MQEEDLEIVILSLLFEARLESHKTGGVSANALNIHLNMEFKTETEPSQLDRVLKRLVSTNLIEEGEPLLFISSQGMDYLFKSAAKKYGTFAYITKSVLSILKKESEKVTPKLLMERIDLQVEQRGTLELSVWYLIEKGLVKFGEQGLLITSHGLQSLDNWEDDTSFEALF